MILVMFAAAIGVLVWAFAGSRQPAEGDPATVNVKAQELAVGPWDRLVMPWLSRMGRIVGSRMPSGRIAAMRRRITLAGLQNTWNVEKAMAYKVLTMILGVLGAFAALQWQISKVSLLMAGASLAWGYFAVEFWLDKKAAARQLEIQQALPDVLDQITVCVEAGLGFDAAIHRCSQSNQNPLGDELGRTLQDIRLGVPRTQALHSLLDRTDIQELRLFVRALVQAERSGIPIARVLEVQADEVREKRRQAAEERAMKLPVLLIMPLVLCILPALFMVIMGPAALRMINEGAV